MQRIFLAVFVFCCMSLTAWAEQLADPVQERLAQDFALLKCPNLDDYRRAENSLARVFTPNGKVNMFWLLAIQERIEEFSNQEVVFSKQFQKWNAFGTGEFMALEKETGKQRRYRIFLGADQVACEVLAEK